MSLWDVFGEKSTIKSASSISSKASKLPDSSTFEAFESIEIIDSDLKQGLRVEPLLMPETPGAGDQEHGGEGVNGEFTARPDEFAAHIEQVRSAWPDGPPMQCQDVPDWSAFCVGWWRDCFQCPYYDANPASYPCALWEAAFPGVVRWYPI